MIDLMWLYKNVALSLTFQLKFHMFLIISSSRRGFFRREIDNSVADFPDTQNMKENIIGKQYPQRKYGAPLHNFLKVKQIPSRLGFGHRCASEGSAFFVCIKCLTLKNTSISSSVDKSYILGS